MGETYGGDLWGRPMGETAPNAVLYGGRPPYGGDRPMGETAPNAVLSRGY